MATITVLRYNDLRLRTTWQARFTDANANRAYDFFLGFKCDDCKDREMDSGDQHQKMPAISFMFMEEAMPKFSGTNESYTMMKRAQEVKYMWRYLAYL